MDHGGRPKHSYWNEGNFKPIFDEKGKIAALCPICQKVLKNTAENRLRSHRNQCKNIKLSEKDLSKSSDTVQLHELDNCDAENNNFSLKRKIFSSSQEFELDSTLEISHSSNNNLSQPNAALVSSAVQEHEVAKAVQSNTSNINKFSFTPQLSNAKNKNSENSRKFKKGLKPFFDTLDENEIVNINKDLIKFLIACNVPFESIESIYFIQFMKSVRPAYKLPTSEDLLTDLIDEVCISSKVHKFKFNGLGVLLISYQKNSGMLVSIVKDESGKNLFIDSCDSFTNYKLFISKCIKIAKENYQIEIYAVISNAVMPLSISSNVCEDINYWYFQCVSKNIESLTESIISNDYKPKINSLIMEFSKEPIKEDLIKRNGNEMNLLSDEKINNTLNVFESVLHNFKIMKILIVEKQSCFDKHIIQIMFDEEFESGLKNTLEILKKICDMSNKNTMLDYTIADSAHDWIELKLNCKDRDHASFIEKELKTILNDITLVSYYLNPMYRGENLKYLDAEYLSRVQLFFIEQFEEQDMDALAKFEDQIGIFDKLSKKNYQNPQLFWRVVSSTYPSFSKFCKKIHLIPAYTSHKSFNLMERPCLNYTQQIKIKELYYSLKINESSFIDE